MWRFLQPEPHKPMLPQEKIDPEYKKLRLQVFVGIFIWLFDAIAGALIRALFHLVG